VKESNTVFPGVKVRDTLSKKEEKKTVSDKKIVTATTKRK